MSVSAYVSHSTVSIQNQNIEIFIIILNNILIFFWKSILDLKLLPQSIKTYNPK